MTIEATSRETNYLKHTLLITSIAGTWELLINYFNSITETNKQQQAKQHDRSDTDSDEEGDDMYDDI